MKYTNICHDKIKVKDIKFQFLFDSSQRSAFDQKDKRADGLMSWGAGKLNSF